MGSKGCHSVEVSIPHNFPYLTITWEEDYLPTFATQHGVSVHLEQQNRVKNVPQHDTIPCRLGYLFFKKRSCSLQLLWGCGK